MFKNKLFFFFILFFGAFSCSTDNQIDKKSELREKFTNQLKSPSTAAIFTGAAAYFLAHRIGWRMGQIPMLENSLHVFDPVQLSCLSHLNPLFLATYLSQIPSIYAASLSETGILFWINYLVGTSYAATTSYYIFSSLIKADHSKSFYLASAFLGGTFLPTIESLIGETS